MPWLALYRGGTTQRAASFSVTGLGREQLRDVLADYLALDRARTLRRLLVVRLASLALLLFVTEAFLGLPAFARSLSLGLCLLPAAGAWARELRLEWRLSRRLDGLGAFEDVHDGTRWPSGRKKVIKSS